MYLLLVEDDDPKRAKVKSFLTAMFPEAEIGEARSVRSSVNMLKLREPDLLFLDMSLPTFDITDTEPGGRPQGFGGKEVFRYLGKLEIGCPTIVVTGYEAFMNEAQESVGLPDLDGELKAKFPANYRGLVYYNSLYSNWIPELKSKIEEVLGRT